MSIYHLLTLSISNSSREQPTACAPTYSPYAEQLSQWSPITTVGSPHPVAFHQWSLTSLWHATLLPTLSGHSSFPDSPDNTILASTHPSCSIFLSPPQPLGFCTGHPSPPTCPQRSELFSGSPSSCKQQLPTTSLLKIEPTFPITCSVLVSSP